MDDETPLTIEDRRHGPIPAVLVNPGGRTIALTLVRAPMVLTYRYGSVERDYEFTALDAKGQFVYTARGELRPVC